MNNCFITVEDKSRTACFTMDKTSVEKPDKVFGKPPLTVNFNASCSRDPDGPVSYSWLINGQKYSDPKPSNTFTVFDTYSIQLIVTDSVGQTDKLVKEVIVSLNIPPTAEFNKPIDSYASFEVTLDGSTSSDPDGYIKSYIWSSSDGQTANGKIASLKFNKIGDYIIILKVIDNLGDSATVKYPLIVKPICVAEITPINYHYSFKADNSSVSAFAPSDCIWTASSNVPWINITFGANILGNGTLKYSIAGNTTATERIGTLNIGGHIFTINQAGIECSDEITIVPDTRTHGFNTENDNTIKVNAPQDCEWTHNTNVNWANITSVDVGNGILTYDVVKNEGESERSGTFIIAGRNFEIEQNSEFENSPPIIDQFNITPSSGNAPFIVNLSANAHDPDSHGSIVDYIWATPDSDGQTATGQTANFTFTQAGSYVITLTVKDNHGLITVKSKTISVSDIVVPPPKISSYLTNISTRANINGGLNDIFAGFIISGSGMQQVIIRGIAVDAGVDTGLTLFKLNDNNWDIIAENNEWREETNASEISNLAINLQLPDRNNNDAGILINLEPGIYSVQLSSFDGFGLAVIGVDATHTEFDNPKLINISTRAYISGGANDIFAGFIISGKSTQQVMIRGIAVVATGYGVDPNLTLLKYNGTSWDTIATNDEWENDDNASLVRGLATNLQLPDRNNNDAGLLRTLEPGIYTVKLSSNSIAGLALIGVDAIE